MSSPSRTRGADCCDRLRDRVCCHARRDHAGALSHARVQGAGAGCRACVCDPMRIDLWGLDANADGGPEPTTDGGGRGDAALERPQRPGPDHDGSPRVGRRKPNDRAHAPSARPIAAAEGDHPAHHLVKERRSASAFAAARPLAVGRLRRVPSRSLRLSSAGSDAEDTLPALISLCAESDNESDAWRRRPRCWLRSADSRSRSESESLVMPSSDSPGRSSAAYSVVTQRRACKPPRAGAS